MKSAPFLLAAAMAARAFVPMVAPAGVARPAAATPADPSFAGPWNGPGPSGDPALLTAPLTLPAPVPRAQFARLQSSARPAGAGRAVALAAGAAAFFLAAAAALGRGANGARTTALLAVGGEEVKKDLMGRPIPAPPKPVVDEWDGEPEERDGFSQEAADPTLYEGAPPTAQQPEGISMDMKKKLLNEARGVGADANAKNPFLLVFAGVGVFVIAGYFAVNS